MFSNAPLFRWSVGGAILKITPRTASFSQHMKITGSDNKVPVRHDSM